MLLDQPFKPKNFTVHWTSITLITVRLVANEMEATHLFGHCNERLVATITWYTSVHAGRLQSASIYREHSKCFGETFRRILCHTKPTCQAVFVEKFSKRTETLPSVPHSSVNRLGWTTIRSEVTEQTQQPIHCTVDAESLWAESGDRKCNELTKSMIV